MKNFFVLDKSNFVRANDVKSAGEKAMPVLDFTHMKLNSVGF